ncbi:hypothetical protein QAD02_002463 [Eretmocerus hayati]|uniref:Uncharacterized protein n=1 Tax=Eretmocerus hayati TaxID=131215 RepID=A0ACC2NJA2_9HYME|nr:hypothetical protein QAD02_002463 [Eretmocerus hayati]
MESAGNKTIEVNFIDSDNDQDIDEIPRSLRDDVENFEVGDLVEIDMGYFENFSAEKLVEQRETRFDKENFRENSETLNFWSTCDHCHANFKMGDDENLILFESLCEECKIEVHSELEEDIEIGVLNLSNKLTDSETEHEIRYLQVEEMDKKILKGSNNVDASLDDDFVGIQEIVFGLSAVEVLTCRNLFDCHNGYESFESHGFKNYKDPVEIGSSSLNEGQEESSENDVMKNSEEYIETYLRSNRMIDEAAEGKFSIPRTIRDEIERRNGMKSRINSNKLLTDFNQRIQQTQGFLNNKVMNCIDDEPYHCDDYNDWCSTEYSKQPELTQKRNHFIISSVNYVRNDVPPRTETKTTQRFGPRELEVLLEEILGSTNGRKSNRRNPLESSKIVLRCIRDDSSESDLKWFEIMKASCMEILLRASTASSVHADELGHFTSFRLLIVLNRRGIHPNFCFLFENFGSREEVIVSCMRSFSNQVIAPIERTTLMPKHSSPHSVWNNSKVEYRESTNCTFPSKRGKADRVIGLELPLDRISGLSASSGSSHQKGIEDSSNSKKKHIRLPCDQELTLVTTTFDNKILGIAESESDNNGVASITLEEIQNHHNGSCEVELDFQKSSDAIRWFEKLIRRPSQFFDKLLSIMVIFIFLCDSYFHQLEDYKSSMLRMTCVTAIMTSILLSTPLRTTLFLTICCGRFGEIRLRHGNPVLYKYEGAVACVKLKGGRN